MTAVLVAMTAVVVAAILWYRAAHRRHRRARVGWLKEIHRAANDFRNLF